MTRVPYNQIAAIRADYHEALRIFHPGRVEVLRAFTPPGLLCCIRVRVHAPTYSVGRSKKKKPRPRPGRSLDFEIRVRKGYPVLAPTVWFYGDRLLASPNVNCMGVFLRNRPGADNRIPAIVTEVLRAILFVDRYEAPEGDDSERAAALAAWQRDMQRRGRFPTGEMENYLSRPMPNAPSIPVLRPRRRRGIRR